MMRSFWSDDPSTSRGTSCDRLVRMQSWKTHLVTYEIGLSCDCCQTQMMSGHASNHDEAAPASLTCGDEKETLKVEEEVEESEVKQGAEPPCSFQNRSQEHYQK